MKQRKKQSLQNQNLALSLKPYIYHQTQDNSLQRINTTIRSRSKINNEIWQNNRKHKSIRMIELQQKFKVLIQLREVLMKQYNSLLQFYQTNEVKLHKIIMNELANSSGYLYSKQILNFIKNPDLQPLKALNFELFKHDLIKITQFLAYFSARKKIKQVEIIKQGMIKNQIMIRNSSSSQQYQMWSSSMRQPFKTSGFTIYDQYKSIRTDFNLPILNLVQQQLYNKMGDVQEFITKLMKKESKFKRCQPLSSNKQNRRVSKMI